MKWKKKRVFLIEIKQRFILKNITNLRVNRCGVVSGRFNTLTLRRPITILNEYYYKILER